MVRFSYCLGNRYICICSWKRIGKHKFTEVSPNKTIEGCIGGVIGAVLLSIVYTIACNKIWNLQINYIFITVISVILSIIGQLEIYGIKYKKIYRNKRYK